jgi:hypothetical protein
MPRNRRAEPIAPRKPRAESRSRSRRCASCLGGGHWLSRLPSHHLRTCAPGAGSVRRVSASARTAARIAVMRQHGASTRPTCVRLATACHRHRLRTCRTTCSRPPHRARAGCAVVWLRRKICTRPIRLARTRMSWPRGRRSPRPRRRCGRASAPAMSSGAAVRSTRIPNHRGQRRPGTAAPS